MSQIQRYIFDEFMTNLSRQKVSILLGARRVGKTNLIQKIFSENAETTLLLNGEDVTVSIALSQRSVSNYKQLIGSKKIVIIDEAQHIPEIAWIAKLMIDEIKPLHIILTGSSAFDLHQMSQPLVGRTISYQLFPIAQIELSQYENKIETMNNLEERLRFGTYPELFHLTSNEQKISYLKDLIEFNLAKDLLAFENLKNSQKLTELLRMIAHQIGQEVSIEELGRQLQLSKNTVDKYLDLLSKIFIIFKRSGYSNNLRKEITKSHRWYFYDNGIRNAVINDFNHVAFRDDIGMLWENYFISERMKYNAYLNKGVNSYFWRTYDQQEIDLIEEKDGQLNAIECKWKKGKVKTPTAFKKAYTEALFQVVNKENYMEFIC